MVATNETAAAQAPGDPVVREGKAQIERLRLSWDNVKEILFHLKLCRYFDERMETLYRQGKLPGAIYSGRGQEGTHVGAAYALERRDSLFPTHRDLSAQLTKGLDLKRVMAQFWGRIDGYTRGRDGNSHVGDWENWRTFTAISHLPIAYPVAVGAALAYKRRNERRVAMGICGDGATSNGRWHEALNVSAIHRLPVVWVVNNNQWAYSTPNKLEFAIPTIAERAAAYGMPGVQVDGANVLDVYEASQLAVERARAGEGPTLIESVSLRWKGHAGHDPANYVPKEMLEEYMQYKDPVRRFHELLLWTESIEEKDIAAIEERVKADFDAGYEFAQSSPLPDPADVTKGLWAEDGYWRGQSDGGQA